LIHILLVDDHAVVREGYRRFLERSDDLRVIGEAEDADDGYRLWTQCAPDVTVVDLSMRGAGGLRLLQRIAARAPGARCLVFSMHEDALVAQRALEAGARGYLLKTMPPGELVDAIRQVHAGRKRIPSAVAAQLAEHVSDEALTPREVEVLRHIAQGNRNKDIAERLFISEETVKVHVKHVMDKLGASDRTEAVAIGIRRGIIQL